MGFRESSTTIDGDKYTVHTLPAKKSWRQLLKISKVVGPAMAPALDQQSEAESLNAEQMATVLFDRLTEDLLDEVCKNFAAVTQVETAEGTTVPLGEERHFDHHFSGRVGAMFQWIAFCIQHEYDDFLGELRRIAAAQGLLGQGSQPKKQRGKAKSPSK